MLVYCCASVVDGGPTVKSLAETKLSRKYRRINILKLQDSFHTSHSDVGVVSMGWINLAVAVDGATSDMLADGRVEIFIDSALICKIICVY